jgi:Tat protein secretion system quality control protein TatD with DNase activity
MLIYIFTDDQKSFFLVKIPVLTVTCHNLPKDRLLVETDAPYIAPNGIRVNSPVYLGEVIEVVARHRHDRLEDVCRQT